MERLYEEIDRDKWDYLFIRAWKKNDGAIRFYQRNGFQLDGIIEQEKTRKDQSGTFTVQKQYLWKKL